MLTKIIFVVVLIMPNGDFASKSTVVQACPSVKLIGDHYEARLQRGEILDWNATCLNMKFAAKKEAT